MRFGEGETIHITDDPRHPSALSFRPLGEPIPVTGPTDTTLPYGFCKYWDSVFIKANGRVPCGCDHGEIHTLVDAEWETVDFVPDVLNGPDLRNMRVRTVLENQAFIDHCRLCAFFKPLDP